MKKSGMEDAYLITIHSIYRKPVANSIFNAEKLEASNSQKGTIVITATTLTQILNYSSKMRERKLLKRYKHERKKSTHPSAQRHRLTLKTPKGPQQANALGLLSCYISVAECRSILQRSTAFQYTKIQMS